MRANKDRNRRPFIWQDEMAEVKNLFRKVAKVKSSGFTGFSVWKDEPTAETLSRNRLRRRRAQFALDMTHLNYGESPYEALNHLHNIRGMCSRIQRQDLFVERKKKDYDADVHPSLIRRPVTAIAAYAGFDSGDRASLHRRPSSAPNFTGTPLYYTAPKPTVLYDATHRCPRYRSCTNRRPSSVSSSRSARSVPSERGWDSASTVSSPATTSIRNQNTSTTCRLSAEYGTKQNNVQGSKSARGAEVEVSTSELFSSGVETGSQDFSSSVLSADQRHPSSRYICSAHGRERPPSRLISKRPPRYKQQQQVDNSSSKPGRRDDFVSTVSSGNAPKSPTSSQISGVPDSPRSNLTDDVFIPNNSSSPSPAKKDTGKLSDRSCGLWVLKQQQHRPVTTDSVIVGGAEDQKQRPSISWSDPGKKGRGKGDKIRVVGSGVDHSGESWSEREYSARPGAELSADSCGTKSFGGNTSSSGADETDNGASAATDDDSHILIKHSTDPYTDFKTSMMHMISEEGLMDKKTELEELFQYYMDLNPMTHHDVLERVIRDIRKDIVAEESSN